MALAVVRDLRPDLRLESAEEVAAFEQDLLAEFVLARASAGVLDDTIRADVGGVLGLREWFGRPLWEMQPQDLDRYFGRHRRGSAPGTKVRQAAAFAVYFEFLELRHKATIHAATGVVVESPLDEVNRPRGGTASRLRIPPSADEAARLFSGWRADMEAARKYAPAARNYTAARLTSLIGPRISELCLLRIGDVRWDLGRFGKILFKGKGSVGRGKKERLVPLINGSRDLLEWWVTGPRWEFDDRAEDPMAPLFPSERRYGDGSSRAVTDDALRSGLAEAVARHLPHQINQLTPHVLRHFAASDLYRNGMDVVAIQEILGHEWLNTTMIYVHVEQSHVEDAWVRAGQRAAARFGRTR
ncbi:tyrosine-type recombinase/integrase [Kitasatospora sp. NPDC048545]|uniref:tyrosine-type recombinase/integrase n=1 Tax=Kitasatospora sp. NPDC048545 TaxID=3157208 RepID=UPI003400ED67